MKNYFLFERDNQKKLVTELEGQIKNKEKELRSLKQMQMVAKSMKNIENWVDLQSSDKLMNSLKNGTIPLINPTMRHFCDRQTSGIYLRKLSQQTSKQRANEIEKLYLSGHLEHDFYNPISPNQGDQYYLRLDEIKSQKEPLRFGLTPRQENERLANVAKKNSELIDHTGRNMKMQHSPQWKNDIKSKWVAKRDFYNQPNKFTSKTSWQQMPARLEALNYQYIDGNEVLGEISRKSYPELMGARPPFIPTIKMDPQELILSHSQSLRTYQQDLALGVDTEWDKYSINKKLDKNYNDQLIKTKSMDHIIPYSHSNNFKQLPLKDLRPKLKLRFYNKSVVQYDKALFKNKSDVLKLETKKSQLISQNQKQQNTKTLEQIEEYPAAVKQDDAGNFEATNYFQEIKQREKMKNLTTSENKKEINEKKEEFLLKMKEEIDDTGTKLIVSKYFQNE